MLWAVARMKALKWLPEEADPFAANFSIDAALIEYQQFHGLPVTGQLDDATQEHLQAMRFCGLPDQYTVGELRTAPQPAIWQCLGSLPGVPDGDVRSAIQESFDRWSRAVAIPRARQAQPGEPANTIFTCVRMDGRNGTLADMYLPGPIPQNGRIDTSEAYIVSLSGSIPPGRISLIAVLTHEIGHRHLLGHLQTPNCLMNPIYNPSIDKPQPGDISAMAAGYPGTPALPPTPTPVPPGGESKVTIEVYGARKIVVPGYTVTKA